MAAMEYETLRKRDAWKKRDATKIYLRAAHNDWQTEKLCHYAKSSHTDFAAHLLQIHRRNCSECHPVSDEPRLAAAIILLLPILLCRRLLSHFQDVCYVPVATSTPMQAKQSVQKCYEGTVSKDQDENAAEDEDEATSAPLQAKQCLQFPELYKGSVTGSKMTDETLSACEDDETLSASEDEDEDIGINHRTPGNLPNISMEDEVFHTDAYGTDDDGVPVTSSDDVSHIPNMNVITVKKCIAFVPAILDLLKQLHGDSCKREGCHRKLIYRSSLVGTALTVDWTCYSGHRGGRWQSQTRFSGMFAGNFQLAVCILLSGNSHKKFELLCKFLNLACISVTSFQRIQRLYAVPAIQNYWDNMERDILDSYQGQKAILCGDGRNDSPGHSAHYLSYSLADANKNCIVHTEVVDVREVNGKVRTWNGWGLKDPWTSLKGL
ncbi:uncharacterized protein [Ptychodera flava]|uniref:uncharacterized protein n=1 Tax=Ptychodera flava TaxID=63121 RepID=UPI003969CFA3